MGLLKKVCRFRDEVVGRGYTSKKVLPAQGNRPSLIDVKRHLCNTSNIFFQGDVVLPVSHPSSQIAREMMTHNYLRCSNCWPSLFKQNVFVLLRVRVITTISTVLYGTAIHEVALHSKKEGHIGFSSSSILFANKRASECVH